MQFNHPSLPIPDAWQLVSTRHESQNRNPVTIYRYQPDELALGYEHVSFVMQTNTPEPLLLGYSAQLAQFSDEDLPATQEAASTSAALLKDICPDYFAQLTHLWTDRHDETILALPPLTPAKKLVVAGIKVKMQHASGLYAWVIVGRKNEIITVERNIHWDSRQGRRNSQMWLHDHWVDLYDKENRGGIVDSKELPAPLALLTAGKL